MGIYGNSFMTPSCFYFKFLLTPYSLSLYVHMSLFWRQISLHYDSRGWNSRTVAANSQGGLNNNRHKKIQAWLMLFYYGMHYLKWGRNTQEFSEGCIFCSLPLYAPKQALSWVMMSKTRGKDRSHNIDLDEISWVARRRGTRCT